MFKKSKGFTFLEILLIISIIAVLVSIVIIAINPSRQFATVRNTQRKSNLAEINKALQQYYIDHSSYPSALPITLTEICDTGAVGDTNTAENGEDCGTLVNLSSLVPAYLVAIPVDPQGPIALLNNLIPTAYASSNGTGYYIKKDSINLNKVILTTVNVENATVIAINTTEPFVSGPLCYTDPVTGFSAGDGATSTPYQICNWTQLSNIRNHLSSQYILNTNLSSTTPDYLGLGDSWVPIGSNVAYPANAFTGKFNGNIKTISDLIVNRPENDFSSLFGYNIAGSLVTSIGLINTSIIGNTSVGGLVGSNSGIVINSYSIGSVTGVTYVGGLIGYSSGSLSDSYSAGIVTSTGGKTGGLVGSINTGATISRSYSTANVNGGVGSYLGGLIGYIYAGTVSDCYSTGSVGSGSNIGGLVGYKSGGSISNSYSTGDVTSSNVAGGLVGTTAGPTSGSVSNSYSVGNVIGGAMAGGFAGYYKYGSIANCGWWTGAGPSSAVGYYVANVTYNAASKSLFYPKIYGIYSTWNFNVGGNWVEHAGSYPTLSWQ